MGAGLAPGGRPMRRRQPISLARRRLPDRICPSHHPISGARRPAHPRARGTGVALPAGPQPSSQNFMMPIASPRRRAVLRPSRLGRALGAERLVMSRFATFATLYTMALYLEPAEHWVYPFFTGALARRSGASFFWWDSRRRTLPILLVMASAQPFVTEFPDVANHVNVELACNVLLIVAIAYALIHRRSLPHRRRLLRAGAPGASGHDDRGLRHGRLCQAEHRLPQPGGLVRRRHDARPSDRRGDSGAPVNLPAGPFLIAGIGLVAAALVTTPRHRPRGSTRHRAGAFGLVVAPGVLTLGLARGDARQGGGAWDPRHVVRRSSFGSSSAECS